MLHSKRGRDSERPAHRDEEWPPLAATRESPRTETKTQHSQKKKKRKNCIITEAEERISDLEGRMVEITAMEQNKEKRIKRNEDSLKDLWDNIKHTNIHIIGVPEGEEREKGPEKIFGEIIVKNFPNMGKEIAAQDQEAQRVPGRINPRRNTPRHMVIISTKIKTKKNY